jgi:4-phospho-D-threonate 3-dehydrogenase / 4-phospho-D-erythronate 3-dehydrogenase
MSTSVRPHIAITLGDPAGVGSEVVLKALSDPAVGNAAEWIVVGDAAPLEAAAVVTGLALEKTPARFVSANVLSSDAQIAWGSLRTEYGHAAAQYVRMATTMCLAGEADGMVTAPLNKEAVSRSGLHFTGHTEYSACDVTSERVVRTILLGHDAVRRMGNARPRVRVCGLNPHAGENGLFGDEDAKFIAPAVHEARRAGIECEGPLPADTLFVTAARGGCDLIVAMYHDQGHIPMKLLDFEGTVNVSLGIPILRTSVDHGTAFDIAGKNRANAANMKSALLLAARMATAPETHSANH